MSLTPQQRTVAVQLLVEKSNRNLEQAVSNADKDYWDLVANRLYYSIFHAVTALMMIDCIKASTHKGTSSQFGLHYVLTGQFSREEGMLYSRLQTMREKADYQNVFTMPSDEGNALIAEVKTLQKHICDTILAKIAKSI